MICEFCKLMYNPLKRELLFRIYAEPNGINIGVIADQMSDKGLLLSGVSQYLKQFERLGLIRRSRAGRYVNYYPRPSNASINVRTVITELLKRAARNRAAAYQSLFGALMNPFRARVISLLSENGPMSGPAICEKTNHITHRLKRDLKPAVDAGVISADDSDPAVAVYSLVPTTDPVVRLMLSLC